MWSLVMGVALKRIIIGLMKRLKVEPLSCGSASENGEIVTPRRWK
tara:strand:+ start:663 stop:797 length:135 start_codon:yes stop_codon:yes gene_type:complete